MLSRLDERIWPLQKTSVDREVHATAGQETGATVAGLESEVSCDLRTARTASTQVGVAAAYVGRCSGLNELVRLGIHIDAKAWQQRIAEVRVIQHVKEIRAQFHRNCFGQVRSLGQREVEVRIVR